MDKKIGDTEKHKFHYHKDLILIDDADINKILVSNKVLFGKKGFNFFIDYKDDEKAKPLCIMHPKMSRYRKNFNETKYNF